jgi:hypothetical protein
MRPATYILGFQPVDYNAWSVEKTGHVLEFGSGTV